MMRALWVSSLLLLLCGGPAIADKTSEARIRYQKASAHFAVGEFVEAAEEYQLAYKLKQDPALLYNAAQAYPRQGTRSLQEPAPVLSQREERRRNSDPDRQGQGGDRGQREGAELAAERPQRAKEDRHEPRRPDVFSRLRRLLL
jgi:hypothetical protein